MFQRPAFFVLFLCLLILVWLPINLTSAQTSAGSVYIVQPGDTLSSIAANAYGDSALYLQIIEGTNVKAQEDRSFRTINNPNQIRVGQKLWIPSATENAPSPTTIPAPTLTSLPITVSTPTTIPVPTTTSSSAPAITPTSSVASAPTQKQTTVQNVDCSQFSVSPDSSQPSGLSCAYITVPEDHFDPNNQNTIQIAVMVVKASTSTTQPDPVVYLQGGPGGPSIDYGLAITEYFLGLEHPTRDLVYIDQRGVGRSVPNLSCYAELLPFVLNAWQPSTTDDQYLDGYFASLRNCVERLKAQGVNLSAYTSAQNAADIIAVSKALGYRQINLYGISYGSRLALTLLRDFGHTGYIRSAVIGGVYGPDANALEFGMNLHQRAELLFEACEQNFECNEHYPNLRTRFYQFIDQLDKSPITLRVMLPSGHVVNAQADETAAYYYLFKYFVIGQRAIGYLPQNIDSMLNGNTNILAQGIWDQANDLLYQQNWGMNTLVQCQEEFLLLTPQEIATAKANTPAQVYDFGYRFQESSERYPDFCRSLGLQPANPIEASAVTSSVPTLAISGRFDPFTPPEWASRATASFPNLHIYTLENAGHESAAAYSCAQPMVHDFLSTPTQAPNSACVAQQKPWFFIPN